MPEGWHDLGDKQLRYVYQLLADDFTPDEMKTLCLLQWSNLKVIGQIHFHRRCDERPDSRSHQRGYYKRI